MSYSEPLSVPCADGLFLLSVITWVDQVGGLVTEKGSGVE